MKPNKEFYQNQEEFRKEVRERCAQRLTELSLKDKVEMMIEFMECVVPLCSPELLGELEWGGQQSPIDQLVDQGREEDLNLLEQKAYGVASLFVAISENLEETIAARKQATESLNRSFDL